MYIPDDDVLNVLNTNTQNNNYNDGNSSDDELKVLNDNAQTQSVSNKSGNIFGITLDEDDNNARQAGYVDNTAGVQHVDYDDVTYFENEENLGSPVLSKRNKFGGVADVDEGEEPIISDMSGEEISADSPENLYREMLGVTQYSDLRKMCGLKDSESFTDYYNRTGYIPKGFETTARLLLAEEKVKKVYARYKAGEIGYADFLYKAYAKDILKSQGIDVSSKLYWYNKAKKGDFTNPLDSTTYLADILAIADQEFQKASWYESASVDNIAKTALVWASGGAVTPENIKTLFKDQIDVINKYFESEEEFIKLYKAGYINLNTFNPFIDIDNDGIYDYYFAEDGKLYAAEGSSGKGNNVCKIYYETDKNGNKVVDRVTRKGVFGTGEFGDIMDSFLGSFFSVFTGLVDFGGQMVGLIGHAAGNDDLMLNWNAIRNNNLAFGGSNTKDFQGFQASEGDDWARGVSSAVGTIVGMIASYYIAGVINKAAGAAGKAASAASKTAIDTVGRQTAKSVAANVGAKALEGTAWAVRTYNGLRGGNMTTVVPKLAEHAMANRMATAAALAIRDGVSTANKLIIQNKILKEEDRLSEGEIVGRTLLNIGANTVVSFALRAVGDSGVTDFWKKEGTHVKNIANRIDFLNKMVPESVVDNLATAVGQEKLSVIGSTLLGKGINTIGDIIENIVTQTNTAFLSNAENGVFDVGKWFETAGGLVANPSFIITNLYIAKQDMGFKLFGRDSEGKRVFKPHTEQNFVKAAIVAGEDTVKMYDEAMNEIKGVYADLIKNGNEKAADDLMRGIIEPAERIYVGSQGESTVTCAMKALTWLMNQTVDIPVESLVKDKKILARLTPDEKQNGPVRAIVLAGIKEGAVKRMIARAAYTMEYYNKAYEQIYKTSIDTFKGEFSLVDAYTRAKERFEAEADDVYTEEKTVMDEDGIMHRVTGEKYIVDVNKFSDNERVMNALEKVAKEREANLVFLTKEQRDAVIKELENNFGAESTNDVKHFEDVINLQTENVAGKGPRKMTLKDQLNYMLGLGGLNARLSDAVIRSMAFYKESRQEDYENLSPDFKGDFEKAFDIDIVMNNNQGQMPEEYEKLAVNESFVSRVREYGYPDGKSFLNSAYILKAKGDMVNDIRAGGKMGSLYNAMVALAKVGLIAKVDYNDGGVTKTLFAVPGGMENLFGSMKTADAISTALSSVYTLCVSNDAKSFKSASNLLLQIFLERNLQLPNGKTAKSYVKDFVFINDRVNAEGEHDPEINSNTDFLSHPKYKEGSEKLLSTLLASFAATNNDVISRPQLIRIFDSLGISYNSIDASGNDAGISFVKNYLNAYEQTGEVTDLARKIEGDPDRRVSETDLNKFSQATKILLSNPEVQKALVDDGIISKDFFKHLEDLNFFTRGQSGEVKENSRFVSLVEAARLHQGLDDYLENDNDLVYFAESFIKMTDDINGISGADDKLISDLLNYREFVRGTNVYDKKNLIIVNLSRLETASLHKLIRQLEVETYRNALRDDSAKVFRALEKELSKSYNLESLQSLCNLQLNNDLGVLTFDLDDPDSYNEFKNLMMSIGYKEVVVDGTISAGRAYNIPGVSFTSAVSRGLTFDLSLEKYKNLMANSKITAGENALSLSDKGKALDVALAVSDRYGLLFTKEEIENLSLDDIENRLNIKFTKDGFELDGIKSTIKAILKLGKSASKLDKYVNRTYGNYYENVFNNIDTDGRFGNALTILNIIKSALAFQADTEEGTAETNLYSVKLSQKEFENFEANAGKLYKYVDEKLNNGVHKVVIADIQKENWTLDFIVKNFCKDGKIDMRSIFVLPAGSYKPEQLSEITYNARTIKVDGMNAGGVNFLEFIREQNFDRFDDLEEFYNFINKCDLNIGDYDSEESIRNNMLSVIKEYLTKETEQIYTSLKEQGLTDEDIKIIYLDGAIKKISEAVRNNMGEYTNFGVDSDGVSVLEKLDYSKISEECGYSAVSLKRILSLLKTPVLSSFDDALNIFILQTNNPFTDVASMIRYDSRTGKAFISLDDIMVMTKEQFKVLEDLGLVTKQLKDKLTLIGKYDEKTGFIYNDTRNEEGEDFSAVRTTYDIGKETTQIQSNGSGYIPNENTEKIADYLLTRAKRIKDERNQDTFFKKLSAMNPADESDAWLAKALNLYTTGTVDNPGSNLVANMDNSLAVGEMLNSISSLSFALQDTVLPDGTELKLDKRAATELALKIYFNTTGTDMSASYNRYTIAYKDENDQWHIESVGENINGAREAVSLGRQLFIKGILDGKTKYKEAYLFNSSKNVMSANAASFGENIKVMQLNEENLSSLKNQIYENCLAVALENGYLKLSTDSKDAKADAIAKVLGSAITRPEIRTFYLQNAKADILSQADKLLNGLNPAIKESYINAINNHVDKLLSTTLETVENLQSSADWMSLKEQALATINTQKGILSKEQFRLLEERTNKMIADTIDAYTYLINQDSLPKETLGKINEMIGLSKDELSEMSKDGFDLIKDVEGLYTDNEELFAKNIERYLNDITDPQEKVKAVAAILRYHALSGERGKNLQFALLGSDEYLSGLRDSYLKDPIKPGQFSVDGRQYDAIKEVGKGKKIVSLDLENFYKDVKGDEKIYEIGFAMFDGNDELDFDASKPTQYRILIKYDDEEYLEDTIKGYRTLASDSTDSRKKASFKNYVDNTNLTRDRLVKNSDGQYIYVIHISSGVNANEVFTKAINKILSMAGNDYVVLGHNTKGQDSDFDKIRNQFGVDMYKLLNGKLNIDTLIDVAKNGYATDAKINESSLSLENLAKQMGIEYDAHSAVDDAIFTYQYFLWKMKNQIDVDKMKSGLYEEFEHILEKIGAQDIDRDQLNRELSKIKVDGQEVSFADFWQGDEFKDTYEKYGTKLTSDIIQNLINYRNAVFNSDEASYIRKRATNVEHDLIYEAQSAHITWLSHHDQNGNSNLDNFRERISLFIKPNENGQVTRTEYTNGMKLLNSVFLDYRTRKMDGDRNFRIEDFLRMDTDEIIDAARNKLPELHITKEELTNYVNAYTSSQEFEDSKLTSEKTFASNAIYNIYDEIGKTIGLDGFDDGTKILLFDIMSGLKTGNFAEAFRTNANGQKEFIVKYNGPAYEKSYYVKSLEDAINDFAASVDVQREWTMPSGVIPGQTVKLENGDDYSFKSTDVGMTRQKFQELFGGATIEDYRESLGLSDGDDLFIQLYRVPGVGQNVIHTYRVRILDSNKYDNVLLAHDIFAAYHSGDFDGDKVIILKPTKYLQKVGNQLMNSTDKIWEVSDKIISKLYSDSAYDSARDDQVVNNFADYCEQEFGLQTTLQKVFDYARDSSSVNPTERDAYEKALAYALDQELINKVNAKEYPTLSTDETSKQLYYSDFLTDKYSDEVVRRLSLDTKFLIDQIISVKDSATGFASKKYKPLLEGFRKTVENAADLFTYNQVALSKTTKLRLAQAIENDADNVFKFIKQSIGETYSAKIFTSIDEYLDDVFNDSTLSSKQKAQGVINALKMAELLYRGTDEFNDMFNKLTDDMINNADLSDERTKVKKLIEYASYNQVDTNGRTIEDVDRLSLNDLTNLKYNIVNNLDPMMSSRRFMATSGDTHLSSNIVTNIRSQISKLTDASKIKYIDADNSTNWFAPEILLATGMVRKLTPDTFAEISGRFTLASSRTVNVNIGDLSEDQLPKLSAAFSKRLHGSIKIGDQVIVRPGEKVLSADDKYGNHYTNIFDEDGELLVDLKDIVSLNVQKEISLFGNKLGILGSGDMKGTQELSVAHSRNNYGIGLDIESLNQYRELLGSYYSIINSFIETIEQSKGKIPGEKLTQLKDLNTRLHQASQEQAQLTADYKKARDEFDADQIAHGEPTWDQLAAMFRSASEEERDEIRLLHKSVSMFYQPDIQKSINLQNSIQDQIDNLLSELGFKNKEALYKQLNESKEKIQELRRAMRQQIGERQIAQREKNLLKDSVDLKERTMLYDLISDIGIDPAMYDIDNMDIKDVRNLYKEFKKIDYVASENLLSYAKQSANMPGYEIIYLDEHMNPIDDPNKAVFTKIKCRMFCPEAFKFWDTSADTSKIDTISYVNDRTNPDSLVQLHGKWYSKAKDGNGNWVYVYDSTKENEINNVISKANTPWASSTNGTRVYRTLLAKVLYENCSAAQAELKDINVLMKQMLDGNSTSGSLGAGIINKIFTMMTDDEVRKLYTSDDPYIKFILNKMRSFMPKLTATDAKEWAGSQKLLSKNKAKELAKNKTLLYYYTKAIGNILNDQAFLSDQEAMKNGYPLLDNSDTYYPLEKLIAELATVSGVKDSYVKSFSHNVNDYTLMGLLNFVNGRSGNQSNEFNPQSNWDSIVYPRKEAAIAGPAGGKLGDTAEGQKGITPDQQIMSQYYGANRTLSELLGMNKGNNISQSRDSFLHGDFATRFTDENRSRELSKEYYPQKMGDDLAAYASDTPNRLAKARMLTTKEDRMIADIAPRFLGVDSNLGISYTSKPQMFDGTYGDYANEATSEIYGWARHDMIQPIVDSIKQSIGDTETLGKNFLSSGEEMDMDDVSELAKGINKPSLNDIDNLSKEDLEDLRYIQGYNVSDQATSLYNTEGDQYDKAIESLMKSKAIADFDIDRLASSNIKQPGMDRAIVSYNINVKTYRNQLLGKEFIEVYNYLDSNTSLKNGYNEYTRIKNLLSSLQYCDEKLEKLNSFTDKRADSSIKYYTNTRAEILKALNVTDEAQIETVKQNVERYHKLYANVDTMISTVCERLYAAQKAYCNATGQVCPSRERFFLPTGVNGNSNQERKENASILFAGTAKYNTNPFAIRKETTGLNPANAYTEFDALKNIASVATEVGKLQAILTYREEAKSNGAMNNALSFDETCKVVNKLITVDSMNNSGATEIDSVEYKGYSFFTTSVLDQLGMNHFSENPNAKTSCAKYAHLYNSIYNQLIAPLKETYGDITFGNLMSMYLANPQDKILDRALKGYAAMMDIVGKITTIQIERGEKTTVTDEIYQAITKYANEHDLAIVDQFGRKYDKDLSQFKALTPFATDDYIFRATHGGLATEGTYEQNVALDALRGDLYFMNRTVADATQKMFYTREPSQISKFANTVKSYATRLIMANPAKFVSRIINFSMFDLNSSLLTGNWSMVKELPKITKELSGYLQSNGEYCPDSLREFMNVTGIDPLKDQQVFYGETIGGAKTAYGKWIGKQFTAQHLANRYALWLSIKNTIDNEGIDSVYSKLGNSYYLKDQIKEMYENMKTTESEDSLSSSASARIAAMVVANQYGTYNDMPGLAGSMSQHGFMFTTFPMALLRFAKNEIRSGAFAIKEIFTGAADTATLKYLGRQLGSLISVVAIQAALQILPALLIANGDKDEEKELVEEVIKNDTSLDLFQSILLNDAVYNTSTLWNPIYGVKSMVANPIIDAVEKNKDNTSDGKALQIFGDALATYFNQNIWNRINPLVTTIPNIVIPKNDWINPYGNQGTDFFDNLARKTLSYALGTNGANAFMNTVDSAKYDDDANFINTLGNGLNNALREELGNSKSYKSSWKNYNNAISIIYDYKKASDSSSYDVTSANFDKNLYSGLKAKLKNAMKIKSSPVVIYNIIKEALDQNVSKNEIKSAIAAVSVRIQIQRLANKQDFFNSLSQKDYNSVKSALAYEDSIFPNLDDLYVETVEQEQQHKINTSTPSFSYTSSLKTYGYNYPTYQTYSSNNYRRSYKNNYYNNLSNWNTNTYKKKYQYNQQCSNPINTYNQAMNNINYGVSTDIWGNQTRHYTDGTEYTVRQQGMPFPGGNKK